MNDFGILFLSLLALVCQLFLLVLLAVKMRARFSPGGARAWTAVADSLASVALLFAFAVASVTLLGSLYLSEVKGYVPCLMCWIQRALLYPIVVFAGLAAFVPTTRRWARRAIVALAALDIPVSSYHVLVERYPTLETTSCSLSTPCTLVYFESFGYLTTPGMALTAAVTLMTLAVLSKRADHESTAQETLSGQ